MTHNSEPGPMRTPLREELSVRLVDIYGAPAPSVSQGYNPLRLRPGTPGSTRLAIVTEGVPHRVLLGWAAVRFAHREHLVRVRARRVKVAPDVLVDLAAAAEGGDLAARVRIAVLLHSDHGIPDLELGQAFGIDRADANRLRRLDEEPELLQAILARDVSFGHARYLLGLPPQERRTLLRRCVAEKLSGRELAALIAGEEPAPRSAASPEAAPPPTPLEQSLSERLGTNVTVAWDPRTQRGELRLPWSTLPMLQGLCEQLGRGNAMDEKGLPTRLRMLGIEFDSLDELNALIAPIRDPEGD